MKFLCRDIEFATKIHEGLSFEVSSKVYLSSNGDTPRLADKLTLYRESSFGREIIRQGELDELHRAHIYLLVDVGVNTTPIQKV